MTKKRFRVSRPDRVKEQNMINEIKGQLNAGDSKFAIVVSRFNEFITGKLLSGAIDCLQRHGAPDGNITVLWVPGAIEITLAAKNSL